MHSFAKNTLVALCAGLLLMTHQASSRAEEGENCDSEVEDKDLVILDCSNLIDMWDGKGDASKSMLPTWYSFRAGAWLASGDLDKAFEDAEQAISINPRVPAAHRILAIVHKRRGKYEAAILEMTKAIDEAASRGPVDPTWYSYRADMHEEVGDSQAAISDHTHAIEAATQQGDMEGIVGASFYCDRSEAYSDAGDEKRAEEDRQAANKISPDYCE